MARGRRVRLDVRWDPDVVLRAQGIAEGAGVRVAEVMRRAVVLGLDHVVVALRAESTSRAGAGRAEFGPEEVHRHSEADLSAALAKVRGAGAAPPEAGPPPASPRPSVAAGPRMKLIVVVAQRAAGGRPAPVDVAAARRRIVAGQVKVNGVVVRDPDALVDPAKVEA